MSARAVVPTRVKCLHRFRRTLLAAGPGVNSIGRALAMPLSAAQLTESSCRARPHELNPGLVRERTHQNEAMTRVAAIDCGTNSIRTARRRRKVDERWSPAPCRPGIPTDAHRAPGAGRGCARLLILRRSSARWRPPSSIAAHDRGSWAPAFVATSATRDASNSADFVRQIKAVIGVEPEVVVGTE